MTVLVVPICTVLLLLSAPAWAGPSRDDAAAAAQRLSNGRVLSIEKSEPAHRAVWRVKVVTAQGEVRVILIDAVSGRIEPPDRLGFTSPSVQ
jgi:peptidase YpeB-like protein